MVFERKYSSHLFVDLMYWAVDRFLEMGCLADWVNPNSTLYPTCVKTAVHSLAEHPIQMGNHSCAC